MFMIFFGLVMFYLCLGWSGVEGNAGIVEYVSGGAGKKDQSSVFFLWNFIRESSADNWSAISGRIGY